jgi:hypothetical protein
MRVEYGRSFCRLAYLAFAYNVNLTLIAPVVAICAIESWKAIP